MDKRIEPTSKPKRKKKRRRRIEQANSQHPHILTATLILNSMSPICHLNQSSDQSKPRRSDSVRRRHPRKALNLNPSSSPAAPSGGTQLALIAIALFLVLISCDTQRNNLFAGLLGADAQTSAGVADAANRTDSQRLLEGPQDARALNGQPTISFTCLVANKKTPLFFYKDGHILSREASLLPNFAARFEVLIDKLELDSRRRQRSNQTSISGHVAGGGAGTQSGAAGQRRRRREGVPQAGQHHQNQTYDNEDATPDEWASPAIRTISNYTLVIRNVRPHDEAQYHCALGPAADQPAGKPQGSPVARLMVLEPPRELTVEAMELPRDSVDTPIEQWQPIKLVPDDEQQSEASEQEKQSTQLNGTTKRKIFFSKLVVRQNSRVKLECRTSQAKPQAELIWFDSERRPVPRAHELAAAIDSQQQEFVSVDSSRSLWTFRATPTHHDQHVACHAHHPAFELMSGGSGTQEASLLVHSVRIDVQYEPLVRLVRVQQAGQSGPLAEFDRLEYLCQAHARPNVLDFSWFIDGLPVNKTSMSSQADRLVIERASRQFHGREVKCQVRNSVGVGESKSQVELRYSAAYVTPQLPPSLQPDELADGTDGGDSNNKNNHHDADAQQRQRMASPVSQPESQLQASHRLAIGFRPRPRAKLLLRCDFDSNPRPSSISWFKVGTNYDTMKEVAPNEANRLMKGGYLGAKLTSVRRPLGAVSSMFAAVAAALNESIPAFGSMSRELLTELDELQAQRAGGGQSAAASSLSSELQFEQLESGSQETQTRAIIYEPLRWSVTDVPAGQNNNNKSELAHLSLVQLDDSTTAKVDGYLESRTAPLSSAELQLSLRSEDSAGRYICVANQTDEQQRERRFARSVFLVALKSPRIVIARRQFAALGATELELVCLVQLQGANAIDITWSRGKKPIEQTAGRFHVRTSRSSDLLFALGTLKILAADYSDFGVYTCNATNGFGSDSMDISLEPTATTGLLFRLVAASTLILIFLLVAILSLALVLAPCRRADAKLKRPPAAKFAPTPPPAPEAKRSASESECELAAADKLQRNSSSSLRQPDEQLNFGHKFAKIHQSLESKLQFGDTKQQQQQQQPQMDADICIRPTDQRYLEQRGDASKQPNEDVAAADQQQHADEKRRQLKLGAARLIVDKMFRFGRAKGRARKRPPAISAPIQQQQNVGQQQLSPAATTLAPPGAPRMNCASILTNGQNLLATLDAGGAAQMSLVHQNQQMLNLNSFNPVRQQPAQHQQVPPTRPGPRTISAGSNYHRQSSDWKRTFTSSRANLIQDSTTGSDSAATSISSTSSGRSSSAGGGGGGGGGAAATVVIMQNSQTSNQVDYALIANQSNPNWHQTQNIYANHHAVGQFNCMATPESEPQYASQAAPCCWLSQPQYPDGVSTEQQAANQPNGYYQLPANSVYDEFSQPQPLEGNYARVLVATSDGGEAFFESNYGTLLSKSSFNKTLGYANGLRQHQMSHSSGSAGSLTTHPNESNGQLHVAAVAADHDLASNGNSKCSQLDPTASPSAYSRLPGPAPAPSGNTNVATNV